MHQNLLTSEERVSLSTSIKNAVKQDRTNVQEYLFEEFETIKVLFEYDTVDNSLIFSIHIKNVSKKIPPNFIGCPETIGSLQHAAVYQLCNELDTVLRNDLHCATSFEDSQFTHYNQSNDSAWYLYEVYL